MKTYKINLIEDIKDGDKIEWYEPPSSLKSKDIIHCVATYNQKDSSFILALSDVKGKLKETYTFSLTSKARDGHDKTYLAYLTYNHMINSRPLTLKCNTKKLAVEFIKNVYISQLKEHKNYVDDYNKRIGEINLKINRIEDLVKA